MRVYRCITARELTSIYKGGNERLPFVKGCNTHKYNEDKKYIHFFRYSDSCKYYFNYDRVSMNYKDLYVAFMVANIPNEILKQYAGYGYYCNYNRELLGTTIPLPEYAIPEELFKPEYVVLVNNCIPYNYSNSEEHKLYIDLIKRIQAKYGYNEYKIYEFLDNYILSDLLGVVDDPRDEEQIEKDEFDRKMKEFKKAFPHGVYD